MFGRQSWRKRYFVLEAGTLKYYKSVQDHVSSKPPVSAECHRVQSHPLLVARQIQCLLMFCHIQC
jgi:hypothetical protein